MADAKITALITAKDTASGVFKNFGSTVVTLNQGIELLGKTIDALTAPFASVINEGRAFGAQMSAVKAISKVTSEEFKKLTDEAKRIGETTAFSSIQAGQAMEELRRAGLGVEETLSTTAQAMDLAAATGTDLAAAAQVTAVQLKIFEDSGLEAQKAVDLMVQTVGASPQNFENLRNALETSSGTASAAGINFEDLTAIIGAMAEAGVRGEKAGTALNGAIARFLNPSSEAKKVLDKYKISLEQVNPTTQNFADILDVLNKANIDQADLLKLLGQEVAPKFFKVIEAGGDSMRNFAEAQKEANTASEAAAQRLDNLEGDITIFSSALSGLKLSVFETMDGLLRTIVKSATAVTGAINEFVQTSGVDFAEIFADIQRALEPFIQGLGHLLVAIGTLLQAEAFLDLLNSLETSIKNVFNNGVLPLVTAFQGLVQEIFRVVTTNETLQEIVGVVIDIFKEMLPVVEAIYTAIFELGSVLLTLLKNSFEPLFDFVANVVLFLLESLRDVIKAVKSGFAGVTNPLDIFRKALKKLKELVDSILIPFGDFINNIDSIVNSGIVKFGREAKESFDSLKTSATNLASETSTKLSTAFDAASNKISGFIDSIVAADEAGQNLEMTLTGNTLSESARIVGEALAETGREMIGFKAATNEADTVAQGLDSTLSNAVDEANAYKEAMRQATEVTSEFNDEAEKSKDISFGEAAGQVGMDLLNKIPAVQAGIQGFQAGGPWGAVAAVVAQLLADNEAFMESLGEVNTALNDLAAPIAEELVPINKAIAKLLRNFKPLFEEIGRGLGGVIFTLGDFINRLNPLLQLTIEIIEANNALLENLYIILETVWQSLEVLNGVLVDSLVAALMDLTEFFGQFEGVFEMFVWQPLMDLRDTMIALIEIIEDLYEGLGGTTEGGISGLAGSVGSAFGFASGTDSLSQDQLLRLPGMEAGSGLVKAHVGEKIINANNNTTSAPVINITMKAINPKEQTEELRQLMESLFLTGRLRVS